MKMIYKITFPFFETRITEGYKQNINFAGKYIWIQWGCGTSCQVNLIINAENGKIIYAPQSSLDVEYKSNSSMIIVDPYDEDDQKYGRPEMYSPPKYYYLNDDKFIEIK